MNKKYNIILLVFAVFVLTSCFKADLDKMSDKLVWNPNLSIAAGTIFTQIDSIQADTLPLDITMDLYYEDTLYFNFTNMSGGNPEFFRTMMFRIKMTNEFPAECSIRLYYNDTVNLFPQTVTIDAAKIDTSGVCISSAEQTVDVVINNSDIIDDLVTIKYFMVETHIKDLTITKPVQNHLQDYVFKVQLGTQMQIYIDE